MLSFRSTLAGGQAPFVGIRALGWLLALPLLACRSDQGIVPEPVQAPALASVLARLPFVSPLLAGASTSPARALDRDGFVVEGQAPPSPGPAPGRRLRTTDRPTRVELGELASDTMRVMTTGAGWLSLRRQGARAVAGRVDEGVVVFADAFPGADALVVSKDGGVEELVLARSPETRMVYEVDLPSGWKLVEHAGPGLVEARDERGVARLRVVANKAWDAGGAEVPVRVEVKGREIALRVEGKATWPVVVDPFFVGTASLAVARARHTATRLNNGKVLIAGGGKAPFQGVVEVYDPTSKTFTAGASKMISPRTLHTATRMADGKVLIAGGIDEASASPEGASALTTAELYDPVSGVFSATPPMNSPRGLHTGTALPDGRVLLAGGQSKIGAAGNAVDTAEVYDPVAGSFSVLPAKMSAARATHTATLLQGGQVLLAGGFDGTNHLSMAERFDPSSGAFASVSMSAKRGRHAAVTLGDGKVLLVGGEDDLGPLATADVYDPAAGAFLAPAAKMASGRANLRANLLGGGKVLVSGGEQGASAVDVAELYDPVAAAFLPVAAMGSPRSWHEATTLDGGEILITGGLDGGASLATAELFIPAEASSNGMACEVGAACLSGHCVDGVCCDVACEGGCFACSKVQGASEDGQCSPRPEGATPRSVADCKNEAGNVCGPTGMCGPGGICELPGLEVACAEVEGGRCQGGSCKPAPPLECDEATNELVSPVGDFRIPCSPGRCKLGQCVLDCESKVDCVQGAECIAGQCKGVTCLDATTLVSLDGQTSSCQPFLCKMGQCTAGCQSKADCAKGSECIAGQCEGGTCLDATTVVSLDGLKTPCAPYRCETGQCTASCTSNADCAAGSDCDRTRGVCLVGACNADRAAVVLLSGQVFSCAPFLCESGACLTECKTSAECQEGSECRGGKCQNGCSVDRRAVTRSTTAGAVSEACGPYLCSQGACARACISSEECAPGFQCDADRTCKAMVPGAGEASGEDDGGCSLAPPSSGSSARWLWGLAAAVVVARRRRRAA